MTFPKIENLAFEQTAERLKVSIPLKRNWLLFGLFTLCLIIWLGMVVVVVGFIFRDVLPNRERYTFVLTVMMVVWLILWYYMGKAIWQQWQYYTADRELLFINKEVLVLRRPVSFLGITDAYDMNHVTPFYFDAKHNCPAFYYGSRQIYFGRSLTETGATGLINFLNGRFFPETDENDY